MGSKDNKLALAVVAVLLLFLWLWTKKSSGDGDGTGPAIPAGTIGTVGVSQGAAMAASRHRVRMFNHLASKQVGDPVTVNVIWTPTTTQGGKPKRWDYGLDYEMIQAGAVLFGGGLALLSNVPSGELQSTTVVVPGITGITGNFDFRVILRAPTSDPTGKPTGIYVQLADMTHLQALRVS